MTTIYEAIDSVSDKADCGATGMVAFVFSPSGAIDVVYGTQNGNRNTEQARWYLEQAYSALESLLDEE